MQFKKGILCAAALTLLSGIAVMLTGCSDGRMLSDKELAEMLTNTLGEAVEIIEAPEGKSNGSYSMKCADGTEFTVERMWKRHKMFGPMYCDYECDYLVNWVNDHPELNAMLDERGISYLDIARGIRVIASNFDEVHTVVETVCALVEDDSNYIPAVSDFSGEYDLRFLHPFILVECLNGKNDEIEYLGSEFEYQDDIGTVDYDEELEIFLAEQKYVDKVRSGDIEVSLPDELLEKYGPYCLHTKLMKSEYDLTRANYRDEYFPVGKTEMLYYFYDNSFTVENKTLVFPKIAAWAECTGFAPYAADSESYTLARGEEKVVLHFSDSECYAERDGVRVELRGNMRWDSLNISTCLTTEDLTKLFDTEFKFDYINGTAEITNKKT
jgi:hypothetical protein